MESCMSDKIKLHDQLTHIPTGRTGEYVEHVNIGSGYMVRANDKADPKIIIGDYHDFVKTPEFYNSKSKGE